MQNFYLEADNTKEPSLSLYQVPALASDQKRHVSSELVATLRGWQLRLAQSAIASALKRANRKAPLLRRNIRLKTPVSEEDGVRLCLIFRGLKDLKDVSKADELLAGVHGMSREEAYYWFAKVQNGSHNRGVRALRMLLSGVR